MKVSPDNISILNNLGLSRALGGDLPGAEQSLRQAAAAPSAPAKVRQNLALVVGIKGDYSEAQKLVRADLPERVAANNLAFYQQFHPRDIRPAPNKPPDRQRNRGGWKHPPLSFASVRAAAARSRAASPLQCIIVTRMMAGPKITTKSTGRKKRIIGTVSFAGSAAAVFPHAACACRGFPAP